MPELPHPAFSNVCPTNQWYIYVLLFSSTFYLFHVISRIFTITMSRICSFLLLLVQILPVIHQISHSTPPMNDMLFIHPIMILFHWISSSLNVISVELIMHCFLHFFFLSTLTHTSSSCLPCTIITVVLICVSINLKSAEKWISVVLYWANGSV